MLVRLPFRSLRARLLWVFLGFTLLTIGVAVVSLWFYDKTQRLSTITSNIEQALMRTLRIIKLEQDFFMFDTNNPNFFITGQSVYLNQHHQMMEQVRERLYKLLDLDGIKQLNADTVVISEDVKHIIQELENYEREFEALKRVMLVRGFKDYGLEGKMRRTAHALESTPNVPRELVLELRRAEKDYLSRRDSVYLTAFTRGVNHLQEVINRFPNLNSRYLASQALQEYEKTFLHLVDTEKYLGATAQDGLRHRLRRYSDNTTKLMERLVQEVNRDVIKTERYLFNLFTWIISLMILISIGLSYWIAARITKPLAALSQHIHTAVEQKFNRIELPPTPAANDEVGRLTMDFTYMIQEIQRRLQEVKQKNSTLAQQNRQLMRSEQRLMKLNAVKDTFFTIVTQDLKSPLSTLQGFLQLLELQADHFSPQELRRVGHGIGTSVTHLSHLLDNLLLWSRAQTGDLDYDPVSVNLTELIQEVVALYQPIAHDKQITLKVYVEPRLSVRADKSMLHIILRNLLSNALKYSDSETCVELTAQTDEEDLYAEIICQDQGIGIPEEHQALLFRPEDHLSTLGLRGEKGSGFGLLLCKSLIEMHGTQFHINSEVGVGTQVRFRVLKV